MTPIDVIEALGAANPLPGSVAAALPLQAGESELVRQIMADRPDPQARPVVVRRRRGRLLALGLAVAAAAVLAVAVVPFGGGSDGPAPAFAAALVRFANSTPRLLLRLPGWHVVFVEREAGGIGEMHFIRGRADAQGMPASARTGEGAPLEMVLRDRYAQLNWGPVPVSRSERRYIQAGHQNIPSGLGAPVRRLEVEGRAHDWIDVIAGLIYDNRAISLRVTVKSMADLRATLLALKQVDTTAWLEAMPPSVIKSASSGSAIRRMLAGIPLPPGFDATKVPGVHDTQTNYYLGTELTGTVACMWIADWSHARARHDTAAEQRAIAAMATAPHWPLFRWMSRQGAWPQVVVQLGQAMPRGTSLGQPLTQAASDGLGCSQLGVELGAKSGVRALRH